MDDPEELLRKQRTKTLNNPKQSSSSSSLKVTLPSVPLNSIKKGPNSIGKEDKPLKVVIQMNGSSKSSKQSTPSKQRQLNHSSAPICSVNSSLKLEMQPPPVKKPKILLVRKPKKNDEINDRKITRSQSNKNVINNSNIISGS